MTARSATSARLGSDSAFAGLKGLGLAALIGLGLTACGGAAAGASSGIGSSPPPTGGTLPPTGGTQVTPTAVGATFGSFTVVAPEASSFLIHGTLPLTPDTYPRSDGQNPFAIIDYDGTPVACQVEVVSSYPSFVRDGADVVELIARVRRNPAVAPGTSVNYKIVVGYTPATTQPSSATIPQLVAGPVNVLGSVVTLLNSTSNIEIATRDVFGNRYSTRPLQADGGIEFKRFGDLRTEVRTYGTLVPDSPKGGAQATLPHMMGIHAYISTLSNEPVVLMDLRVNNAPDANNPSDPTDDNVGNLYWDSLDVLVPNGWVVLQAFDDPFWDNIPPQSAGGKTTYKLVEPLPGNKLHLMHFQSQFIRRLALCPAGFEARARALLDMEGLAFNRRGTISGSTDKFFSWWNPSTARYFPQSFTLPSLEHVGLANMKSSLTSSFNTQVSRMANGTGNGSYPYSTGVLGWAHPYGVSYGGMTGGDEIFIADGIVTAETASVDGYRQHQLTHRMATDRMPDAVYSEDGEPTRLRDWLQGTAPNQYAPFSYFQFPSSSNDPFGAKTPPTLHTNAVMNQNRKPAYESTLIGYNPIDLQHLIRYTRSPKVLGWLGNDSLAKDDLEMQAEVVRLSYHMFPNGSFGYVQGTGMLGDREYIDMYPGTGFTFGRQEGWEIDVMNAAYAFGDEDFRTETKPWYDFLRDVIVDGQASCSGFMQANVAGKFLSGQYRARQAIEQAIGENAIRGMAQTVYYLDDNTSVAMLEDVLRDSYYSWFNVMSWDPIQNGPWSKAAVGPLDLSLPPWCDFLPAVNGHTSSVDKYQLASSFGYAASLTLDSVFYTKASQMYGGSGTLLSKLMNGGTSNIENRSALLAILQLQNSIL